MSDRRRRPSGFGAPPPPPGVPPDHGPPKKPGPPPPPAPMAPSPAPPLRRGKKKRITLSLPTDVAAQLRTSAEAQGRFFLDMILDAFRQHAHAIESELIDKDPASKRRAAGRTQIPLNIFPVDLDDLDERARRLGLDRSAYVTELLTRYWA